LTSTSFLADIAQNIAGDRVAIDSILPPGADPHAYQPVPADLAKISDSKLLIINGVGYEHFLESILNSSERAQPVIEAAAGLQVRTGSEMEGGQDPHLWLDPTNVIGYTNNIRDGLIKLDPDGESEYRANADTYISMLQDLDSWITSQVSEIPAERRLLVTNHDALGYFADRYGFKVAGTLLASVSSQASVSAQDLSAVVDEIRATGVPAIFLDEVENPTLAAQVAEETGVAIVDDLHIESLTAGPPAGTYLDMMKFNVDSIVNALK
jgi:ABC-type Zn uptake system ZnuABC Zn-binding protein ZnuA